MAAVATANGSPTRPESPESQPGSHVCHSASPQTDPDSRPEARQRRQFNGTPSRMKGGLGWVSSTNATPQPRKGQLEPASALRAGGGRGHPTPQRRPHAHSHLHSHHVRTVGATTSNAIQPRRRAPGDIQNGRVHRNPSRGSHRALHGEQASQRVLGQSAVI